MQDKSLQDSRCFHIETFHRRDEQKVTYHYTYFYSNLFIGFMKHNCDNLYNSVYFS